MASYDFSAAFANSFSSIGGDTGDKTLLELLKDYLGLEDPLDPEVEEQLIQALNLAGDMCETYIDRVIAKRPVDEYFQSHFGRVTLHNYPVDLQAPVNVFLDGVQQSDYQVFMERWGLPHLTRQASQKDMPLDWRAYEQATVTYTAGFDPIPSDLAQAIVYVAADIYASQGTGSLPGGGGGSGAVKSMSIYDVGSISYDVGTSSASSGSSITGFGAINEIAAQMLSRYKRMAA